MLCWTVSADCKSTKLWVHFVYTWSITGKPAMFHLVLGDRTIATCWFYPLLARVLRYGEDKRAITPKSSQIQQSTLIPSPSHICGHGLEVTTDGSSGHENLVASTSNLKTRRLALIESSTECSGVLFCCGRLGLSRSIVFFHALQKNPSWHPLGWPKSLWAF